MYPQQPQSPYGFQQQPFQPQPYQMQPRRSAIPKVLGILMIIFGALGLAGGLIGLAGSSLNQANMDMFSRDMPEFAAAMKNMQRFDLIAALIAIPISAFQLFAGIACVKYKSSGPKLAIVYAVLTVLHSLVKTIIVKAMLQPAIDAAANHGGHFGRDIAEMTGMFTSIFLIFGMIIVLAWALVLGILMTRPAAKAACVN